jgi:hypothetical protein
MRNLFSTIVSYNRVVKQLEELVVPLIIIKESTV